MNNFNFYRCFKISDSNRHFTVTFAEGIMVFMRSITHQGAIGKPLTILNTVDSSNNYAMQAVHAGKAGNGAAFFALEQTAGRGQRGKTWHTNPGENIVVSLVIEPGVYNISKAFELNWAVSLAARQLLENHTNGDVSIKWPNDIYWRDRKAAGILVENCFRGQNWTAAVVGMGMNINQTHFPETDKKPVSLRQITGKEADPLEMVKVFFHLLETELKRMRSEGAAPLLEAYNANLYMRDQQVKLKQENRVFETTVTGVNPSGQLCTRDTMEHCFDFGTVEWLL